MQQILQNLKTSYQKISQSELVNMETLQSFDISESINRENLLSTIEHYLTIHEMEHNWDNIVQT
ncbi:ATP-dependent protease, partial [Bartonella bacilliformis]